MNDNILNANSITASPLYSTISTIYNDNWNYIVTGADNTYTNYTISKIEENSNELKINIKKSQIKFNFNL